MNLCVFESVFWGSWWMLPNCPPRSRGDSAISSQCVAKPFLGSLKSSVLGLHLICPSLDWGSSPPSSEDTILLYHSPVWHSKGPFPSARWRRTPLTTWAPSPGSEEVTFLPSPSLSSSESKSIPGLSGPPLQDVVITALTCVHISHYRAEIPLCIDIAWLLPNGPSSQLLMVPSSFLTGAGSFC